MAMRCKTAVYFVHHPWLGEQWGGLSIGGNVPCGLLFFSPLLHPEDTAIGGRGRNIRGREVFLSLISRTAPSTVIAESQRQPEVKGEWMSEQHARRKGGESEKNVRKGKRGNVCRGYIKWQMLHSWAHVCVCVCRNILVQIVSRGTVLLMKYGDCCFTGLRAAAPRVDLKESRRKTLRDDVGLSQEQLTVIFVIIDVFKGTPAAIDLCLLITFPLVLVLLPPSFDSLRLWWDWCRIKVRFIWQP